MEPEVLPLWTSTELTLILVESVPYREATMSGYSGTPLAAKLGIKQGSNLVALNAPPNYRALIEPLPSSVRITSSIDESVDIAHVFATKRSDLARTLTTYRKKLGPEAVVWVSWPKKSAKVATDITEDTVRDVALPLGFVDVKVCAVDDVWSGLKLVVRKELRKRT